MSRRIRVRKRAARLTKLSVSICRLKKHRKDPLDQYHQRHSWFNKFDALLRLGRI